jgi:hypothetical protein
MSASMAMRNKGTIAVSALRRREPEALRVIGEESQRNGTSMLTSRQIDQIIKAVRSGRPKR